MTPAQLLGTPRVATALSHHLGEGPVWDPLRGRLLWVDIEAGSVYIGTLASGGAIEIRERIDFPDTAGAVAVSADGELVVAGTRRLYYRGADGVVRCGEELVQGDGRRLNDGKPDPRGRFVVGTKGPSSHEQLLQVAADGTHRVLDDDLTLSNGLAWTRDGRRLYSVDTMSRRIHVRDYDADSGESGQRALFMQIDEGYPDGMTIDAEDHLWVAVWGGGCILRISPTGDVVGRVDVPAPHTSCATFAGPDLDTLVITTATEDLTAAQRTEFPLSGRLFTVRPGVRGNPPHLWAGTSAPPATKGRR